MASLRTKTHGGGGGQRIALEACLQAHFVFKTVLHPVLHCLALWYSLTPWWDSQGGISWGPNTTSDNLPWRWLIQSGYGYSGLLLGESWDPGQQHRRLSRAVWIRELVQGDSDWKSSVFIQLLVFLPVSTLFLMGTKTGSVWGSC